MSLIKIGRQRSGHGVVHSAARAGDRVRIVYRHFPLDGLAVSAGVPCEPPSTNWWPWREEAPAAAHPGATEAAVAAAGATSQNRFWPFHHLLMTRGCSDLGGIAGLRSAIEYLERIGHAAIVEHERQLTEALDTGIRRIAGVTVPGPSPDRRGGITSFTLAGPSRGPFGRRSTSTTPSVRCRRSARPSRASGACSPRATKKIKAGPRRLHLPVPAHH
jgi:hypothetical protein